MPNKWVLVGMGMFLSLAVVFTANLFRYSTEKNLDLMNISQVLPIVLHKVQQNNMVAKPDALISISGFFEQDKFIPKRSKYHIAHYDQENQMVSSDFIQIFSLGNNIYQFQLEPNSFFQAPLAHIFKFIGEILDEKPDVPMPLDMNKIKLSPQKALALAEDNGGRKFRQKYPKAELGIITNFTHHWFVRYKDSTNVIMFEIDQTGKILSTTFK